MVGIDYLKLQNQGSIISNIRLLYEMLISNGYADSQGYYTKESVAEIGVNSLIITSGSKVGDEVREIIHADGDESRNSPMQNAKARMQILRVLGLVSTDYGSEIYAITRLGKLVVQQILCEKPNVMLLRELFMGITTATENYEHNCSIDFNCYLGYGICYALANLDYRLSSDEMPMLTTYDIRDIHSFIDDVRENRQYERNFLPNHPHYPKTQKGMPIKQVSNLTRSINQILRVCGIIKNKQERIGRKNYYVCTDEGRKYVDAIRNRFNPSKFLTSIAFRKKNNIAWQKNVCISSFNAMLHRCGVDDSLLDYSDYIFSPYQMMSETSAEWFLGGTIRKHPDAEQTRINAIISQSQLRDLRLSVLYNDINATVVCDNDNVFGILKFIKIAKKEGLDINGIAQRICNHYQYVDKAEFYPMVHSLLKIAGIECKGEVGRYDAYCKYGEHIIPIEIKSYTETSTYNIKGVRQAIENKITTCNFDDSEDLEYASWVIGFAHPTNDTEIRYLIEQAYDIYKIKIIACDLHTLAKMAANNVINQRSIDFDHTLKLYGLLTD